MAYANSSGAARPTHVHPQATPGYGKRSAPEQEPRRAGDFAHLPAREALIAAFVDRLPEGAAMDAKTLAANIPAYGQAACRTAIRRLAEAGHLRMVKEHRKGDGGSMHWVTRTYFSRTARGDAWWETFLRGDVVPEARHEPPARSEAYDALASLGRTDPRMTLSAADCRELEELATQWLTRGASPRDLVRELTAGLPPVVHFARAMARTRLVDKMPPERAEPAPADEVMRLMECAVCHDPGRPEALPGGVCRTCRGEARPEPSHAVRAAQVRDYAAEIRAGIRNRERIRKC
ncbi:hypothetical protein AB0H17_13875 [Streptomyces olivoreticuli]